MQSVHVCVTSGKCVRREDVEKGAVEREARQVSKGGNHERFCDTCEGGQTVQKARRSH